MHDAEILRTHSIREVRFRNILAVVVIHRFVGKRAPHPFECAGIRIEDDDPVIAVAIRHERFVGLWMDPYVRRAVHVLCVGVALALVAATDLQHELAVLGKL